MRSRQKLAQDFPCNVECRGDHCKFHMKKRFCSLERVDVEVTKLTAGRLVNGSSGDGIDMVIKNLELEPKDIIAEFCGPSRWKELSKESGSNDPPHVVMDPAGRSSMPIC
ncbi:hypothetical protein Tco_0731279 [Tanacetum coccineum]